MLSTPELSALVRELALPLAGFAVVTSASPGPVNVIAATSGANFGWSRTMPHVLGATLGFACLILAMGFGLDSILRHTPWLHGALKVLGAGFLTYLAIKLWMARAGATIGAQLQRPPSARQGLLAQWTNPKAWIVAASGIATYTRTGEAYIPSVLLQCLVFSAICLPSIGAWAMLGHAAKRLLASPKTLHHFNASMAFLLLLSVIGVLF